MHSRRAADDVAGFEKVRFAIHSRYDASSLLDQHQAGCNIPGRKLKLKKPVEKAARGVGEIEGGGPGPTNRLAAQEYIAKDRQVGVEQVMGLERETGGYKSPREALAFADAAHSTVPSCSKAADRRKQVVLAGIEDHSKIDTPIHRDADRNRELGNSVHEVGGAIERVDDPGRSAIRRRRAARS